MQYTYPNTPASVSSWGTATPSSPQQRPPVKTHGSSHSTTPAIWSESSPRPSSTISAHASHGATTPPAAPALRSVPLPTFGEPVSRHRSALHPLLGYSPEPYLHCNIMDPAHGPRRRDRCPLNLSETAFHPAVGQLCLRISAYPFWVIPIANPAGITVGDIISHIKYYFQSPISPQELRSFGSDIEQSTLMQAQSRRARYPGSPHIARGDVLGQRTWIHGLVPSVDGTSYEVLLAAVTAWPERKGVEDLVGDAKVFRMKDVPSVDQADFFPPTLPWTQHFLNHSAGSRAGLYLVTLPIH